MPRHRPGGGVSVVRLHMVGTFEAGGVDDQYRSNEFKASYSAHECQLRDVS
jgi:hypothetical protein